jgi:hypothetical protein
MATKKNFGTGGSATITVGGKGQINKQRTRFGSVFGNEKNVPNINLNKYIGKKEGGTVKHDDTKQDKALIKKAFSMHDKQLHEAKKTNLSKLKEGGTTMATKKMAKGGIAASAMGKVKTAAPSRDGIAVKGKTKGKNIVMCGGGMAKKK